MRTSILLLLISILIVIFSCSSTNKTENTHQLATEKMQREKQVTVETTQQVDKIVTTLTDFAEGWISNDRAQAFYSTTSENLKENTDILLARERLAWLLLIERYDLRREDRVIATRLASSNFFQQFGTEKIEKQTSGDRITILLIKSKPGLKDEWENALVTIENRFPELKNRRKTN